MTKSQKKILFDIVLFALWAILMVYSLTGAFWHELIGIALFGLIAAHLLFNRQWIGAVTKRIFRTKFSITTANYIVDALLLVFTLFTTLSGFLVSIALFPQLAADNVELWAFLHGWSAYLSMVLISIHIGLHIKFIAAHLKLNRVNKPLRALYHVIAAALVAYGLLASAKYRYPLYQNTQTDDTSSLPDSSVEEAESASANASYALDPATAEDSEEACLGGNGGGRRRNSHDENAETDEATNVEGEAGEVPTLENYLSKLICTGCRKHCSLLSPQCSIGQRQANEAIAAYNDTYGNEVPNGDALEESTDDSDIIAAISDFDETNIVDVFSIMGMYAAGTFYVGSFASKKKRR